MPKLLKSIFIILTFLILNSALATAAEEISVTTYFPSPYGVYRLLNVYELSESTTQTDFTQGVTRAGLLITTEYTDTAFTPGVFWSTSNNNATRPKAGIYLKETNTGTNMYMGTSNSYATGITNNAIIIDQAGRVTKPAQPAFTAQYNGAVSSPATIVWGTALDNVGGCYNTTTGIFTAPVTGFYVFGYNILLPNASTGEYRLNFYKNGGLFDGIIYVKPAAGWYTLSSTVMLRLNAGDTMCIYYELGSGALYNDVNYNKFWGYLLG